MVGPRRKFRQRPKKVGAKKNTRIKAQKARLLASGMDEAKVKKLNLLETRNALKKI
jgi:hypothetical protein